MNIVREYIPNGYKALWWKEDTKSEDSPRETVVSNGPALCEPVVMVPQLVNNLQRRIHHAVEFYVISSLGRKWSLDEYTVRKVILGQLEQTVANSVQLAKSISGEKPWTVYTTFRYNPEFSESFTDREIDLPDEPQVIGKYSVLVAEPGLQFALYSDYVFDAEKVAKLQRGEKDFPSTTGFVQENGTKISRDNDGNLSIFVPGTMSIGAKGKIALNSTN